MTINPQTLKALQLHISSFVQSYERHVLSVDGIDFVNCDLETAKKFFNSWHRQIEQEKEQLSAIRELWSDGLLFTNKFNEFIISQVECVNNWAAMREFRNKRLDTSNRKSMEEAREFILINRKLGPRIDSLLKAANEILKNETGLDFLNYS